jgi:hypothetical protein
MPRNDTFTLLPLDDDRCIVEAVVRLEREFAGAVLRPAITEVVRRSHQDLDGPHPAALPELVERLARQRLLQGGSLG